MSVNTVNFFLELIAKESKSVMGMLCEERVLQDEELAPSNGAAYYFKEHPDKLKKKGKNTQLASRSVVAGSPAVGLRTAEAMLPTAEPAGVGWWCVCWCFVFDGGVASGHKSTCVASPEI